MRASVTAEGRDVDRRPKAPDHLLTVSEVAEYLRVTQATVYGLIHRGLPSLKIGGSRRFRLADLEAWIDAEGGERS